MMKTKVTELLGIKYPIVQGGMQWVGRAELVSAVSNAGGLGILTALTQPSPEDLGTEIERTRAMTDKPFGVNLTMLPTIKPVPYADYLQVAVDSGVPVIETAGRNPVALAETINNAGMKWIHKTTSIRHSKTAQKLGCDILSVDGFECAGHPGEDDTPGLLLLPRAAEELEIPFIASGGFGNGQGLAAALSLGAEGINMGTRFLATREAPIHDNVKWALVKNDELQTTHIFRTLRNTARIFKNSVAEQVLEIESRAGATDFNDIADKVSGQRGRKVFETGDIEGGTWSAGMVMGLIHDIPSCQELLERIVSDATSIIQRRLANICENHI